MPAKRIALPLVESTLASLRAGDLVLLDGLMYTARDAAHQRLLEQLRQGKPSPIPLADQVIYYVGPAPAKAGHVIGPAGPTTSGRMDPYTIPLLKRGVRGFIGKGYRSTEVKRALVQYGAIYMAAVGGAAALLARQITHSRVVAYPDLGTEAIRELVVEAFPVIVVNDSSGGDAYQQGRAEYSEQ
jgi:fumarate hydratase subunit beta